MILNSQSDSYSIVVITYTEKLCRNKTNILSVSSSKLPKLNQTRFCIVSSASHHTECGKGVRYRCTLYNNLSWEPRKGADSI